MTREICDRCQRAINACVCQFINAVDNQVKVVILQHYKEVGHNKGSVFLLANSLNNCQVLVGEDFSDNEQLLALMKQYSSDEMVLIYPSEHAQELPLVTQTNVSGNENAKQTLSAIKVIVLLDATWKKAYRMYQLSRNLDQMSHFKLPSGIKGQYAIRKTKKDDALSTLEACCYVLSLLEHDSKTYQPLMDNFVAFNQFQLELAAQYQKAASLKKEK